MKQDEIYNLFDQFEFALHHSNGVEYWSARALQLLLGYMRWENFRTAIEKAKIACEKSGASVEDHFAKAEYWSDIGNRGGTRRIEDFALTRFACYLICQNGDPSKEPIAFAQTYFAVQTRKQEVIEQLLFENERLAQHSKFRKSEDQLARIAFQRGVSERNFSVIRAKGDEAFFGGVSTKEMKKRLGVPKDKPLENFLSRIALKMKDVAAEVTSHNVIENDLQGAEDISREHSDSNEKARMFLIAKGIRPENLPPSQDVADVQRKMDSDIKKLVREGKRKK